jgi:CBS domain-containing protein
MNAREVMTSRVISATANTPARDIAQLLLKNQISAIPILDYTGAPIGMVSEGDLIGRDETERNARREWWLALLAEGESLGSDVLSRVLRRERVASEIMSKPVVTIAEDTDTAEIAHLLATHRIKRVPVVRDGRVVGIVSRENLLRGMVNEERSRRTSRSRLRPMTV